MDSKNTIHSLFGCSRALLGVVHVGALPGTPRHVGDVPALIESAVCDALAYSDSGFDGIIIENMHDRPYLLGGVGPEIPAVMAVVGRAVCEATSLPLGVQVLAAANREALAVANACGASFVRAEGFVFAHVGDEGVHESDAGELLRYREAIGAGAVKIFVDIKKKHSAHAITADVDLVETARAAEFFLADGVVVTGVATGAPTARLDVEIVAAGVGIPTFVGSGVTIDNLAESAAAEALIVGSSVKVDGSWSNPVDPSRAKALAEAFRATV